MSASITLVQGLKNLYAQAINSKLPDEYKLDYLLNGIIGRLGVIPFKRKILNPLNEQDKIRVLDFNSICKANTLTQILGSIEKFPVSL